MLLAGLMRAQSGVPEDAGDAVHYLYRAAQVHAALL
jgi:hypothetical protein